MEPVTHLLTGACLARTGFHRRVTYATAAMAVAAEFPDIDTLWSLRGPVSGFEHHRGITHTFVAIPFEAALLVGAFFLLHRVTLRRRPRPLTPLRRLSSRAPTVHWGALFGLVCLALGSHLLLDFTNNYGLRPFFPFDDRWYAGSIVFIFDPLLFLLLLSAILLPPLFGLIGREVGAKDYAQPGPGWARVALCGVLLLWGVRFFEHGRAVQLAGQATLRAPAPSADLSLTPLNARFAGTLPQSDQDSGPVPEETRALLQSRRALASPDPLSLFRWYTVTDFGSAYQLGVADSRQGTLESGQILNKPNESTALAAAQHSHLGRVYLDWSPMPFLVVDKDASFSDSSLAPGTQVVWFTDPRFMGETPLLHRGGRSPLTGEVILDRQDAVLVEGMDGRLGR